LSLVGSTAGCDFGCAYAEHIEEPPSGVSFQVTCRSGVPIEVIVSGACAPASEDELSQFSPLVGVSGERPGVCHVELRFPDGFTYEQDVTFEAQTPTCGSTVITPTQLSFDVNPPFTSCIVPDGGTAGEGGG
jgi:hypothetical protein